MKLIIDIPEEVKQTFDNAKNEDLYGNYYDRNSLIGKAIQNGIPLEQYEYRKKMFSYLDGVADGLNESSRDTIDVLNKIRVEIDAIEISGQIDEHNLFIRGADEVKNMVLEIINKYRNEVNE